MNFKQEWVTYLTDELEMPRPYVERIQELFETVSAYAPTPIDTMFVSEYVDEDGSREFEGCWLFGENLVYEMKSFLDKQNTDMASFRYIKWIDIESKDFVIGSAATEASRLKVKVQVVGGVSGDFRASGTNCEHLSDLIIEFAQRISDYSNADLRALADDSMLLAGKGGGA